MAETPVWGTGIGPGATVLVRRVTSDGNLRVTSDGFVRVVSVSVSDTLPKYYVSSNVTNDGAVPFTWRFETNPVQPQAAGGENVFKWVPLMLSWSASGTVRVTPYADGNKDDVLLADGSRLSLAPSLITLAQAVGTLQRQRQVFAIPLVRRRISASGVELSRPALRGERIQLLIESTGPLGVGEQQIEGFEIESDPIRKAIYAPVARQGV